MQPDDLALLEFAAAHPIHSFSPSPSFAGFYADESTRVAARGANRVGKTRHVMHRTARFALDHPNCRIRVLAPTRRTVHDVAGRYLAEFLQGYTAPRSYYREGLGWNNSNIRLRDGQVIQLRSYEDKLTAMAGDELDLCVLDEVPRNRGILSENEARTMSRRGRVWLAFTPVGAPVGWLREQVEAEGSRWSEHVIPFVAEHCPWYDPEQSREWLEMRRASPWDYAQRVLGAWDGVTEGRVFDAFEERHVDSGLPRGRPKAGLGADHGELVGHEFAVLVAWHTHPVPRLWIVDEYASEKRTDIDEDARAMLDMLGRNGVRAEQVSLAVGDDNLAGKAAAGAFVNDLLEEAMRAQLGWQAPPFAIVRPDKRRGSIEIGCRLLNYALRQDAIRIHPRCKRVVAAFRHWEGEEDEHKHVIDAVRYIAVEALRHARGYSRLLLEFR